MEKGIKDRTVPLPETISQDIKNQFEQVKRIHRQDLDDGYAGAFMFEVIEKKYKNAGQGFHWQWFFLAKSLTWVEDNRECHVSYVTKLPEKSAKYYFYRNLEKRFLC